MVLGQYSHDAIDCFNEVPGPSQLSRDEKEKRTPKQHTQNELDNTSHVRLLKVSQIIKRCLCTQYSNTTL